MEFLLSDYEEDFEVDEEKQDEKEDEEDQADDQMSRGTKSPSEGEKDNLNPEKEIETSSEKALDACDSENLEDTGCSDSEEDDRQDVKTTSSISSRSHPYSSESEDDSTEVDGEADSVNSESGSSRSSSSQDLRENDNPGKLHFPAEDYLETEIEEQEITKLDGNNGPWLKELSGMHVTEGKPTKGTQALSESELKEPRRATSSEVRAKNQFQKEAGLLGVEEGKYSP